MNKAAALAREHFEAEAALAEVKMPEVELVSVSKDALAIIRFSKDIQFPAELLKTVRSDE